MSIQTCQCPCCQKRYTPIPYFPTVQTLEYSLTDVLALKDKLTKAEELIDVLGEALEGFKLQFDDFSNKQGEVFSRDHTKEEFKDVTTPNFLDFEHLFKALAKLKEWKEGNQ